MNNPQIFDREGKKYEILQEGLVYDDANKSCIRPIGVKKNITIKEAIQKRLIREVSSNYIEIFAPQTEGNDVGTGAELLVLNESEMQVEVQPKILTAKKDNIYFMPARETSLYSVHPLLAPMIERDPPIKFHLETLLERQIIEGFYQRAFFPEEPIRDASAFFAGIRTVSNSKHSGLPKLLVKDSSYAVRDLWVRQYDITLIGRIVQRLMAWNRESIDEQSQVGQYLFFKVSSDPSFEFKTFYKAGKQIVSYRIAKSKVIDLIKEGEIECDYKVLNLLLEKDLQHSQQ